MKAGQPGDALNELALFAGAGGGLLASMLHGWRTIAAVEIEDYPRRVLLQRQADGLLPRFPIWDDICTFDGKPWRGKVDIVTGGFPCQDISAAGKGEGIEGARSGLWQEMARVVDEVRPRYVYIENSPLLVRRGLTTVLRDLAKLGFDARWGVVGADDVAAPHKRKRAWVIATNQQQSEPTTVGTASVASSRCSVDVNVPTASGSATIVGNGRIPSTMKETTVASIAGRATCPSRLWITGGRSWPTPTANEDAAGTPRGNMQRMLGNHPGIRGTTPEEWKAGSLNPWWVEWLMGWPIGWTDLAPLSAADFNRWRDLTLRGEWFVRDPADEGIVPRICSGVRDRVSRLKAIGNGQVPICAAVAFEMLTE